MPFFLLLLFVCFSASAYIARRIVSPMQLPRAYAIVGWIAVMGGALLFPLYMSIAYSHSYPAWLATLCLLSAGFFSFMLTLTLLKDLVQLLFFRAKKTVRYARCVGIIIPSLALILTLVGHYKALHPTVFKVEIPVSAAAKDFEDLRLVQLTDLHITNHTGEKWLKNIVSQANELEPDVLVLTGDVADMILPDVEKALEPLADLQAKYGKYFVLGNHEYLRGQANLWPKKMQELGFTVLNNEHAILSHKNKKLLLAGITDNAAKQYNELPPSPQQAIAHAPEDVSLKILLAHQPNNVYEAANAGFDVQLSGHTHAGQFFPWIYLVDAVQEFYQGLYAYEGTQLYVNQGTGFWGPPIRLGTTSEISLINFSVAE